MQATTTNINHKNGWVVKQFFGKLIIIEYYVWPIGKCELYEEVDHAVVTVD